MITRTVRASDGVALALHRFDPVRQGNRPPVLLVHGAFASHTVWLRGGAKRIGLARFLLERGHDVWLADFRHHGASEREPQPFQWHFGLASLARDPRTGPTGIVTLGTPGPVMNPWRRALAATTIGICRTMGRFPARALRVGSEDEPALVLSEWMAWNVRGSWIGMDGFDYLAALKRRRTPFLSIAGNGDRVFAPAGACRALVDEVGGAATFAAVGPGLDHRGLLLDPRADELCWPLLADWIEQPSAVRMAP